jgi:transketolase
MGEEELSQGAVWEAAAFAARYRLGNLAALIDVPLAEQNPSAPDRADAETLRTRFESFGWRASIVDGHDLDALCQRLDVIDESGEKPAALLARTVRGSGISALEHQPRRRTEGLTLAQARCALDEIGAIEVPPRGTIRPPSPPGRDPVPSVRRDPSPPSYEENDPMATDEASGNALARLAPAEPGLVVLDGQESCSTVMEKFARVFPERYFGMPCAEQNLVGAAVGLSARGKKPIIVSPAAFLTRAGDSIRMAVYSRANIKFVGLHAGSSLGGDGPSHMGLEDVALFRALGGSVVLSPCDAISTERLLEILLAHRGIAYLRTAKFPTPMIYDLGERFEIGGSRRLRSSPGDRALLVGCGVTVPLMLQTAERLARRGFPVGVLDAYSVKPLDEVGILKSAEECGRRVLVIEDHWPAGGLGEAVAAALSERGEIRVRRVAVDVIPGSGPGEEVLHQVGLHVENVTHELENLLRQGDGF